MNDPAVLEKSFYLQFDSICKNFPGVRALEDISFGVMEGSVHALVGENGAGKSTLLKILSGAYQPDAGRILLNGKSYIFRSTAEAIKAGIAVIYQELHLVSDMTVAENLYIGHYPNHLGILDKKKLWDDSQEQLNRLGEEIDPGMNVGRLSIAQRQMVEIAKALTRGVKIIAFDEPTSSLSDSEIKRLFRIIRELKQQGHVILYVSHRMEEIFEICDKVTVFRDGKLVETFESIEGVTRDILINRMVGRDIHDIYNYQPRPQEEVALEVNKLTGYGLSEPASFSMSKGEILGFFGLVGAGRSELLRLIYGARRKTGGSVKLYGNEIEMDAPSDAIREGIVFCSEDRKKEGVIAVRSVLENVNLSARRLHSYSSFFIQEDWEKENATQKISQLNIKTPSLQQLTGYLSGGNQQKVILARWLSENIKVILLDEPTRGIDIGAKNEIYHIMYDLAKKGICIIMVSSDLPEIMGVADRIIVMRQGRIVTELNHGEAGISYHLLEEKILKLALPDDRTLSLSRKVNEKHYE